MNVICADCGSEMDLRNSRYGKFYGCRRYPECKGTHGAHPDGKPLGVPANAATKLARIAAHAAFDELWKSGRMKRGQAYARLAQAMGQQEVHMGSMSAEACQRVLELVPTLLQDS